jgi:CelD/BcsL family acetyltransferase involved in cellulose biosynthesis
MHASLAALRGDTAIEHQANESPYYSQAWLDLIQKTYGYSVIPLTTTDADGHVTGFLPVCSLRTPFRGQRLVALPFADHCPLLARDEASANRLIDQAIHLAHARRAKYLELRTGIDPTLAKRSDLLASNLYVRWLMPLATDANAVWDQLRKPVQQQIKKSRKLGVQVSMAHSRDEVVDYYRLHVRTRCKKHGMPAQPRRFFLGLWDAFGASGAMQILLAKHEETVIAGMVLLAAGTTVRYAYGASDPSYLHLAPNNLLLWAAITWGCAHGFKALDFGRTARDNHGLMEFKRRWGAIEEPLPYYYYPRVAGPAATSENSQVYRTLTACWKRLPLTVAQPLGGYLYKHLG